jgi:hypothetical protein
MGEIMMLRRIVPGLVGAVVLAGSLLTVATAQDAKKDGAKDAKAETKEVKGKITKVDVDKMTFSIETADGKKHDYTVDKDVEFIGPMGGNRKDGIKDKQMKVGAEVRLVLDSTGKKLKEVHLPRAKPGGDKDKDKVAKDKEK